MPARGTRDHLAYIDHNASRASSVPSFCEKALSENLVWLIAMLRGGALRNDEFHPLLSTEAQLCAHLLVELGVTPSYSRSVNKATTRAFVYELRDYYLDNSFGPYLSDGSCCVN